MSSSFRMRPLNTSFCSSGGQGGVHSGSMAAFSVLTVTSGESTSAVNVVASDSRTCTFIFRSFN